MCVCVCGECIQSLFVTGSVCCISAALCSLADNSIAEERAATCPTLPHSTLGSIQVLRAGCQSQPRPHSLSLFSLQSQSHDPAVMWPRTFFESVFSCQSVRMRLRPLLKPRDVFLFPFDVGFFKTCECSTASEG